MVSHVSAMRRLRSVGPRGDPESPVSVPDGHPPAVRRSARGEKRVPLALGEPDSHGLTSGQIRQRGQHQGAGQLHVVKGVVPPVEVAMLDGQITRGFDALLPAVRDQAGGRVARLRRRGGSGCPGGRLGRRRLLATLANRATDGFPPAKSVNVFPLCFRLQPGFGASRSAQTARPRGDKEHSANASG